MSSLQEAFNRVENVAPFGYIRPPKPKKKRKQGGRGFLSMTEEKKFKAQSSGGKKAHKNPKHLRCCEFSSETGRKAALKRWGKL